MGGWGWDDSNSNGSGSPYVWNPDGSFQLPEGTIKASNCTCGTTITLGKDDQPMFHSDYCEVRREYERKNGSKKEN